MKLSILILALACSSAIAEPSKTRSIQKHNAAVQMQAPVKFDFQGVQVSQIIGFVYLEALKQPFVIDPAILKDERLVSFRFDTSNGDLKTFWENFLNSLDLAVERKNGVDFVAPQKASKASEAPMEVSIYRPRFRPGSYLVGLLSPLFKTGGFTINRAVHQSPADKKSPTEAPPGTAGALIDQECDTLVFRGTKEEISVLRNLLPQVDTQVGEIFAKAVVYEVSTGETDSSAFELAINLLNGKLGLAISGASALANSISIKSPSFNSALSALSGDTRFKAISTPQVRIKSGSQARFTVGQDVPTLGAVSYGQNGNQPVQSVEYRSSGVIMNLMPTVRESTVEMVIDQQISDFAKTETGVNNSPTLTKRQLSTSVSIDDGELVLIGGLTQNKNTKTHSGLSFLPQILHSRADTSSRTEILLLMQVSKISSGSSMR